MRDNPAFPRIEFHFPGPPFSLKNRVKLKTFLLSIFKTEKVLVESVVCVFCSDAFLLKINKKFLHHNFYTDIITFNLANDQTAVKGEIYISVDRIRENANTLNEYYTTEFHRVLFHGVLHLCGYQDKSASDLALIRRKEDKYLNAYFHNVPRGTPAK